MRNLYSLLVSSVAILAVLSTVPALAITKADLKKTQPRSAGRHATITEVMAPTNPEVVSTFKQIVRRPNIPAQVGVPGFSIDSQFPGLGLIETIALGSGAIPPDMGGASNGKYVVQMVNGGYAVYAADGKLLSRLKTDATFWAQSGISAKLLAPGVSDPRIQWDAPSGRFFITQINVDLPNSIFIGVSKTSNPLDGFKAVSIKLKDFTLGDFPTLGVNADTVTVSTNNFFFGFFFTDLSVFSIPKADLLLAKPTAANASRFDSLAAVDSKGYGFAIHAVDSPNPSDGTHQLIGVSATRLREFITSKVIGLGTPNIGISPPSIVKTRYDGNPSPGRQPSGITYDNSDDRVSADVKQVGKYIYMTNAVPGNIAGTHNAVHIAIMDTTTNKIVADKLINDPTGKIDYSYPAIDANASGRFVVGYNGSGPNLNISAFATVCDFDQVAVTVNCNAPALLYVGLEDDYQLNPGGRERWGDYNAISLDPSNDKAFYLYQEVPGKKQVNATGELRPRWATVVTHVVTTDALPAPANIAAK